MSVTLLVKVNQQLGSNLIRLITKGYAQIVSDVTVNVSHGPDVQTK